MKIISLNICGGSYYEPLLDFLRAQAPTTDIFCFQEVFHNDAGIAIRGRTHVNFFNELTDLLPDFEGHFAPRIKELDLDDHQADSAIETGLAMFIKKSIEVSSIEETFVVEKHNLLADPIGGKQNWPVVLQKATVRYRDEPLTIAHVHGVSYPGSKLDTPSRLLQSRNIVQSMGQGGAFVLSGDFNLLPDTESVAILEQIPARNLIKECHIRSTRPQSHLLRFAPNDRQSFADYTFVSSNLQVKDFTVPEVEASDHLPLILELK
jgi:hypothetical protein